MKSKLRRLGTHRFIDEHAAIVETMRIDVGCFERMLVQALLTYC